MFSLAMTDTIHIAEQTGVDGAGKPEYGTPYPEKARVEKKVDDTIGVNGNQRVSSHTIYVQNKKSNSIRIWLPGESPATEAGHSPITVEYSEGIANPSKLCKILI